MITTAGAAAARLQTDMGPVAGSVTIAAGNLAIRIDSNNAALITELRYYFDYVLIDAPADITITAIDAAPTDLGLVFRDWAREPGKKGRKDALYDLTDGRLVQKVRTGMLFLQSDTALIAHGPCLDHPNQVINFVNAQYMNHLQQEEALICHASGLVRGGRCLAMAGLSGGGKSTLMLNLLADKDTQYLTNDRLFLKRNDTEISAFGIPKLPRINPGTILHNPVLRPMLSPTRQAALAAMPMQDLWQLEEKYDVDVAALYGADSITHQAALSGLVVLNWAHDADTACKVTVRAIDDRPDLLPAVMKSPGPFYQQADGRFWQDDMALDAAEWQAMLQDIPILEITGRIDFDAAAGQLRSWLGQ